MLNAKNLLISQQITFQQASWALRLLGDPINTQYNVYGEITIFKQEADGHSPYKQYAPTLRTPARPRAGENRPSLGAEEQTTAAHGGSLASPSAMT